MHCRVQCIRAIKNVWGVLIDFMHVCTNINTQIKLGWGGLIDSTLVCTNTCIEQTQVKLGWGGLMHLELVECGITAIGCDILSEKLAINIPLQGLVLDFNAIGDEGAEK